MCVCVRGVRIDVITQTSLAGGCELSPRRSWFGIEWQYAFSRGANLSNEIFWSRDENLSNGESSSGRNASIVGWLTRWLGVAKWDF